MTHAHRGRELESAVGLACVHYRRVGRAQVFKRVTPKVFTAEGVRYTEKAGCDFNVLIAGRGIIFDCKQTAETSLPLSAIKDHQRDALTEGAQLGAQAGLVVGFVPGWRVYWIDWTDVAALIADNWRESLSERWCRAYGLMLPVTPTGAKGKLRVLFLDGFESPDRDECRLQVATERAAAINRQVQIEMPRTKKVSARGVDWLDQKTLRRWARREGNR
jgi:penicillin-binding protein-related factor A (putative recombinase)